MLFEHIWDDQKNGIANVWNHFESRSGASRSKFQRMPTDVFLCGSGSCLPFLSNLLHIALPVPNV